VAFVANLALTLTLRATGSLLPYTMSSVYLVMVVGVAAACADLFTLSAYASGLKVTSSFVIGGTSSVLVLLVGFLLLREPFTWTRLLAAGLVALGILLLQREGL
jgi:drug/metabolite transporter (DMT)-like permease